MAGNRQLKQKRKTSVSDILPEIRSLIESSRYRVAATANLEMVSLHWNIGRVIAWKVQGEGNRPGYVSELVEAVAGHLTQYGRGFSVSNLYDMKRFFDAFEILQTVSGVSNSKLLQTVSGVGKKKPVFQTPPGEIDARIEVDFSRHHYIGWSHYVLLMGEVDSRRRRFYFEQAAGQRWSVRELRRQIQSGLFERVALSKNARQLIAKGKKEKPREAIRYEDIFKDPYVLDFLELDGAFSEHDFEAGILANLQKFLSELGSDFCFIASQFRMRIDNDDYFLDLLFYHRTLRCLIAIDLKIGAFTAADKGQMDLYLSWLKRHDWRREENEPIGLILCTSRKKQHVELLLSEGPHKMHVSEYLTKLPDKKVLEKRLLYYSQLLSGAKSK